MTDSLCRVVSKATAEMQTRACVIDAIFPATRAVLLLFLNSTVYVLRLFPVTCHAIAEPDAEPAYNVCNSRRESIAVLKLRSIRSENPAPHRRRSYSALITRTTLYPIQIRFEESGEFVARVLRCILNGASTVGARDGIIIVTNAPFYAAASPVSRNISILKKKNT